MGQLSAKRHRCGSDTDLDVPRAAVVVRLLRGQVNVRKLHDNLQIIARKCLFKAGGIFVRRSPHTRFVWTRLWDLDVFAFEALLNVIVPVVVQVVLV